MTSHAESLKQQGNQLLKNKKYEEAISIYKEAMDYIAKENIENYDYFFAVLCSNMALAFWHLKNWELLYSITQKGISICEKNLSECDLFRPLYVKLLYRQSLGYEYQGIELNTASNALMKLLNVEPGNKEAIELIKKISTKMVSIANNGCDKESILSKFREFLENLVKDLTEFNELYKSDVEDYIELIKNVLICIVKKQISIKALIHEKIFVLMNTVLNQLNCHMNHTLFGPEVKIEDSLDAIESPEKDPEIKRYHAINLTLNYRLKYSIYVFYSFLLSKDIPKDILTIAFEELYSELKIEFIDSQLMYYIRKGLVDNMSYSVNNILSDQIVKFTICIQENDNRFLRTLICSQLMILLCKFQLISIQLNKDIITLNNNSLLRIFISTIECCECDIISYTGLNVLYTVTDQYIQLKSKIEPINNSQYLSILINSLCQLLSHKNPLINIISELTLTNLFILLADKDRSETNRINLTDYIHTLIQPLHENKANQVQLKNALKTLLLISSVDYNLLNELLDSKNYIEQLVIYAINEELEYEKFLSDAALELIINSIQCVNIQIYLLETTLLNKFVNAINLKSSKYDLETQIKFAIILSKLSLHDESTRILIFDLIDFIEVLDNIIQLYFIKKKHISIDYKITDMESAELDYFSKDNNFSKEIMKIAEGKFKDKLDLFIVELLTFLSIHKSFKESILKLQKNIILSCVYQMGTYIMTCSNVDLISNFCLFIINLLKHNKDKNVERKSNRKINDSGAPKLEPDQMEALKMLYDKLPRECKPLKNGEYDRGEIQLSEQVAGALIENNIHVLIIELSFNKDLPRYIYALISECIWYFSRVANIRQVLAANNVVKSVLDCHDKLISNTKEFTKKEMVINESLDYYQDLLNCKQCLCYICMSINVSVLSSELALNILPHLIFLMKHNYELYNYEACLAITNLTWCFDEIRSSFYYAKGIEICVDVITSDNVLCRNGGLEVLCNMAPCQEWIDYICSNPINNSNNNNNVLFQLLLAFINDVDERSQNAAAGCIAMLTIYPDILVQFLHCTNSKNLFNIEEPTWINKESFQIKIVTIWYNISEADNAVSSIDPIKYRVISEASKNLKELLSDKNTKNIIERIMQTKAKEMMKEYKLISV